MSSGRGQSQTALPARIAGSVGVLEYWLRARACALERKKPEMGGLSIWSFHHSITPILQKTVESCTAHEAPLWGSNQYHVLWAWLFMRLLPLFVPPVVDPLIVFSSLVEHVELILKHADTWYVIGEGYSTDFFRL